jgi:hypothetical protein
MSDTNIILLRNGHKMEIDTRSEVLTAEVDQDGDLIVNAWAYSKESAIEIAKALLKTVEGMTDDDFKPFEVH